MPLYIKHRVNRIDELSAVDVDWGVEIDLRSDVRHAGSLHLSHEPWVLGDNFGDWLATYASLKIQGPLILNTKEDGLENKILECLEAHGVKNYFFLDTALPTLVKWTQKLNRDFFAVRYSSFEPLVGLMAFKGKAQWIWVDCFDANPLSIRDILALKNDFRICLVSPELQGAEVSSLEKFSGLGRISDAICTKFPESWKALITTTKEKYV